MALAASHDLDRAGDVRLDLLDRLHVNQRADHRTWLEAVGDLYRPGGRGSERRSIRIRHIKSFEARPAIFLV